jgi:hypothetical protein
MRIPAFARPLLAVLFLTLAGCDAIIDGGGEAVILRPPYTETVTFTISGAQMTAGQPVVLPPGPALDVSGYLQQRGGFTKGDIVRVEVSEVQLVRLRPVDIRLDAFENARVVLIAQNDETEVATRATFPAVASTTLNVPANHPVTTVLTAPSYRVRLELTPKSVQAQETYEFRVEISFQVTVAGV